MILDSASDQSFFPLMDEVMAQVTGLSHRNRSMVTLYAFHEQPGKPLQMHAMCGSIHIRARARRYVYINRKVVAVALCAV
jgi:hypothetical protein